jgi:riboflavin synthase
MFTGIIETIGTIAELSTTGKYRSLLIVPQKRLDDLTLGDSVAVDGCCLTVVSIGKDNFAVEASPESINLTIIGDYCTGASVNLERALLPSSRLGGHFVTGHIDAVGKIAKINVSRNILEMIIEYPEEYRDLIVKKGSVAINGVSLTVNEIERNQFSVNIIPHTRTATTIDMQKTGDKVNLEFDIIGKYIIRMKTNEREGKLTLDKLIESGW